MFTTVHCNRTQFLIRFVAYALFFLSALPLVALSQEETEESIDPVPLEEETSPVASQVLSGISKEFIPNPDDVIGDFVVGPGKTELALDPGESATVELLVTNRTGFEREFKFEIEDFTAPDNPEVSVMLLGDETGPYTLKDYIKLPTKSIFLKQGERARIKVTISIPFNAEPGGRYGSVLVNTLSRDVDADDKGVSPQSPLITRIGTLFFVTINGDIERDGRLEEFKTIPEKAWFQGGPIKFGIFFRNNSVVHLTPQGSISISNTLGEEVGSVELQPWFALPNSVRFREVVWNRELLFGKYTAVIKLNRGYEDIVDTMEYTFWVLPWKLVLTVFAGVFLVLFIFRLIFKNFEFKRKV